MSMRERRAAYEAAMVADAVSAKKLKPVADAPKVSLKRIQCAYAESAAAVHSVEKSGATPDVPKISLKQIQSAYAESAAAINSERSGAREVFMEPPPTEELLETILSRLADGSTSMWIDLTFHGELTRLSQKAKSDVIYRLADAGEAIETLKISSVCIYICI